MLAYMLLVGVPVLALLGILEAGRSLAAPPALSGDWKLEFDDAACGNRPNLRQPALSVSQSGMDALLTLNDGRNGGRGTVFEATIASNQLRSNNLNAAVTGKRPDRVLKGTLAIDGCPPLTFHATRLAPKADK